MAGCTGQLGIIRPKGTGPGGGGGAVVVDPGTARVCLGMIFRYACRGAQRERILSTS